MAVREGASADEASSAKSDKVYYILHPNCAVEEV
jgi:hypothetical protein